MLNIATYSVQFSDAVVSDPFQPHRLYHARPPCPSTTPGTYSNSCLLSQWCHSTLSSSVIPFCLLPSIFPSIRVFSNESVLHIRWPKFWSFSFSISLSNEYSGLGIDWLDLLAVQGSLKVFSSTIFWKHQFFSTKPSLWSNSHIHTWLLEKP